MTSIKRWASVPVVCGLGLTVLAAPAFANYYNWGIVNAYEGSTLVAQGKGTVGVDYGLDVIGGHATSSDPRPGGSPAYAKIHYNYTVPQFDGPHDARGVDNATSSWVDKFVNGNLNTQYDAAELRGEACQNDKAGPDACKGSAWTNQKW
ncbi:hypothetical protein [Phycicoccus sp. Soil802]|uniref:hypothetical protein n=1 Tax=Phycicoccus sp. Soil802 TaxID=1736414 RepID=UPI0007032AA2|nr:hypothetical protein [Phycicoccus sp. Soil802]KRF22559.1 hypothetical protein ASG91_14045 [Phycicoccus sp. Soil802]